MQSDLSTLLPQTLLTGTSVLFEDVFSWDLATTVSSATDIEVSQFPLSQTSYFYSNASSAPGAHIPEITPSSDFHSESSVVLEAPSVLPAGSEVVFTSAVTGLSWRLHSLRLTPWFLPRCCPLPTPSLLPAASCSMKQI